MRERLCSPIPDAARRVAGYVEGAPAAGDGSGKLVSVIQRLEQIARRVAFPAMSERLDQVGATVPFRALIGVRLETPVRVEHHRPYAHRPALIERKSEGV